MVAALLLGIGGALGAALWPGGPLHMLDFLYLLSYLKVGITLMKYTPQVRPSSPKSWPPGNPIEPAVRLARFWRVPTASRRWRGPGRTLTSGVCKITALNPKPSLQTSTCHTAV